MKWFKNLKMAPKLILSFILVALLIGIIGFIGVHNMRSMYSNSNSMYNYNLQSIEDLMSIKQNYSDIRADMLKIVYQQNLNDKGTVKKGTLHS